MNTAMNPSRLLFRFDGFNVQFAVEFSPALRAASDECLMQRICFVKHPMSSSLGERCLRFCGESNSGIVSVSLKIGFLINLRHQIGLVSSFPTLLMSEAFTKLVIPSSTNFRLLPAASAGEIIEPPSMASSSFRSPISVRMNQNYINYPLRRHPISREFNWNDVEHVSGSSTKLLFH